MRSDDYARAVITEGKRRNITERGIVTALVGNTIEDAAVGAGNTTRPLTQPSEQAEGGLAVDATPEQWRPVVGYEGLYEVSDHGRVRSLDRTLCSGARWSGRVMVIDRSSGRYAAVKLSRGGKAASKWVHRLVMSAFAGPCPDGMEVCHNNGDPFDNRVLNLRYDTHVNNTLDSIVHGTHALSRATHCARGHEFTVENTLRRVQGRLCRACTEYRLHAAEQRFDGHQKLGGNCHRGHPWDAENTRMNKQGKRFCRACDAKRARERRRTKRQAA